MSVWYFQVTNEDGTKYENGPYPDEAMADTFRDRTIEEFPALTVGEVTEQEDDYTPLAAMARVHKADGSRDIIYNDGSVVNVPAS